MKHKDDIHRMQSAILCRARITNVKLDGKIPSKSNWHLIRDALMHWATLPLEAVYSNSQKYGLEQKLIAISELSTSVDFTHILAGLEEMYRLLINNKYDRFSQFKADLSSPFLLILLAPVKEHVVSFIEWKELPKLKHVFCWLRFLSKLEFKMDSLEQEALTSFLATEKRLAMLDLSSKSEITSSLQTILTRWLRGIDLTTLPVRHGPGCVAEGQLTAYQKYHALHTHPLLEKCTTGWYSSPNKLEDYAPLGLRSEPLIRKSVVMFVPKNARKLRTICMEPATLQYFQQGVMRKLYKFIHEHPFLKTRMMLRDQEWNQVLAWHGSKYDSYCTIDLSAASDSVSWGLVKSIFNRTRVYRWMIATRSTHCELPNGEIIKSHKYAPMGSALCFPIECLIFAAVIEYVAERRGFMPDSLNVEWSVYGDDMIAPSEWASDIIEVLNSIGFIVNNDKSYISGPYRESCGKEYYKGYDVTPLYYRLGSPGTCLTPKDFTRLCSGANLAFEYGYDHLRGVYVDRLLHSKRKYKEIKVDKKTKEKVTRILTKSGEHEALDHLGPLFCHRLDTSPILYSPNPTNFHLPKRRFKLVLNEDELQDNNGVNYQVGVTEYLSTSSVAYHLPSTKKSALIGYSQFLIEREFNPTPHEAELERKFSRKFLSEQYLVWSTGLSFN